MEDLFARDYKKTGKCSFAFAKNKFLHFEISLMILAKNSPYTRQLAKGLVIHFAVFFLY